MSEAVAEGRPREALAEAPPWSPWAREYARTPDTFIWGTGPSSLAREVSPRLGGWGQVLELGCGEGRDSIFLAEQGHEVIGLELSLDGLRKAARLAADRGVRMPWVCAAMPDLPVRGPFDLVHSCGSIHYVAREERARLFEEIRRLTRRGGYNAHVVFTRRLIYREKGEVVHYFDPNELREAYADWTILKSEEGLIRCAQDGLPHAHSVETVLARRP
jgi:tellurite methyltransferase